MENLEAITLAIVLAPLFGSAIAGLFGGTIGRVGAHSVTILGVGIAFVLSVTLFLKALNGDIGSINQSVYTWMISDGIRFEIGFLIDRLSTMMMVVVTFVSLMVHIYTVGYMADDEHNWPNDSLAGKNSYQRFFSYISLFTFSMLMLVMSNNFMQLFFGWEAVGLVSYLLIGFWATRESAVYANLKAFLVNRVGDFGFILGIGAVLMYFNTLDYQAVFNTVEMHQDVTVSIWGDTEWSLITVICILLFIGAMGKSAQVPLHVWLPDSMEGPTPISALIHAATMVTAGIFMVARMSPLYELSETALSMILIIGAITAFFMGLLGLVQNDIKRVVAYSTLSQLGYMTVALGASAYAAGMFHLMTHAFFKALLFLGAGSVIIAMHHDQDMRNMGGLRKYMPITWLTTLIGSLALIGAPFFSGFYSKDSIIEAVGQSQLPGSDVAYIAVLLGVFVTALYSFRMYFLVFHGKERMDEHTRKHLHETPRVVTWPLILLAIPSILAGALFVDSMAFGDFFREAIVVAPAHDTLGALAGDFHGWFSFGLHGFVTAPFWLAAAGVATAYLLYMKFTHVPAMLREKLGWLYAILDRKYGFDDFNDWFFAGGSRGIGRVLWRFGDVKLIDGLVVNGSALAVGWFASVMRHVQSGYLYHYAFAMILGLLALFGLFII
ncbi:NADH-quinone oxidoreductase subunit L [Thiohalomonas denitrificans]|uniref:NADH-quinone oxidoreductase subunit L n=1 Tax=Thiohalomonas denitrificans TaxID=415747 RepID=A0A1G5PJQ8_9GAMM|nr:NADH-quinone oxidoreductase subunit L [Thiohalomonas denitrificans]SCZ49431.1 NADH-quinone oxidoreductase subunit L [Thiohalomonas denitrificans]